jgi:tRNA (guanine37-N1)-methyltransferase
LGNVESSEVESHSEHLLEHPHYTQPASFEDEQVPEVLRSGHHGAIESWRLDQAKQRTQARRPDLYALYRRDKS